jgi:aminomethyltransferase
MADRRTPLYDVHVRLGAQMVKGGGDYWFPQSYTSAVDEHNNTRNNVGMQDLSTMGEVDIKGPGAERLLNHLVVNEIRNLFPGQVRYTTMVNEEGGIVDDVTVYKFGEEHFMVVTSSGPRKKTFRWIAEHAAGASAYVSDVSGSIALISVQGPRSQDLLNSVVGEVDFDNLKFFWFQKGRLDECEFIVSRSGYTGELGYELYVPAEEAAFIWEELQRRGGDFGLMPYGVRAMQSLRIEKAFPLYGPDISEEVTPFHLGLDRWIRFDKRDFIGREALLEQQAMGLDQRWVGLILEGDKAAANGDPIYNVADIKNFRATYMTGAEAGQQEDPFEAGGQQVGRVTSSTRGYSVGKMLALAFVDTAYSWPGAKLAVNVGGRPVLATVTQLPFFDPQGLRMRGKGPRKG